MVTSTTGRECESDPITIPVKYVSTASLGAEYGEEKTLEKYNLILFPFDSYDAGPRNERILNEYVLPRCFSSSEVEIVGHTDVVGMYEHNKNFRPIERQQSSEQSRRGQKVSKHSLHVASVRMIRSTTTICQRVASTIARFKSSFKRHSRMHNWS